MGRSFVACNLPDPGPKLDALVDQHLRGLVWKKEQRVCINGRWRDGETWMLEGTDPAEPHAGAFAGQAPPEYSQDMKMAWAVVESMRRLWLKLDEHETCYWQFVDCGRHGWRVDILWAHHDGNQELQTASEMTFPQAVCVAALKWYGVGRGDL